MTRRHRTIERLIATSLLLACLLAPSAAAAQQRVERFDSLAWRPPRGESAGFITAPLPDVPLAEPQGHTWMILGALAGLAIGAGAGYLLARGDTEGCDDGICGWVPTMVLGGTAGLLLGGLIGWGIDAERAEAYEGR